MEKGEPSLVPEWLRSTGNGTGAGCSNPHFASSQTDGPVLALPKRNRTSKSVGSIDSPHSPLGERSAFTCRRNPSTNGSSKHDKNPFSRSYSGVNKSRRDGDGDRERLTIGDNWDLDYSDPLRSSISRRQGEILQQRVNGSHNSHSDGRNGALIGGTDIVKVSFERDFPMLGGSEERPKTPDIIRISSPGLSRGIQISPFGNSTLGGSEGWTSALAEVPTCVGSNSNGLNMAEALVHTPARPLTPQSSAQLQRDELAVAQSKKLIPMTPSLPKALVNPSDKLKPKTGVRSSEAAPKSPSVLLLLKPGRENGLSTMLKDSHSHITSVNTNTTNGQPTVDPSVASVPSKNPSNSKLRSCEQKNNGNIADKRNLQSRSDFFNLMRRKSVNNTSENGASSDMMNKPDKEVKERGNGDGNSVGTERELKCNGERCGVEDDDDDVAVYPNEEEKAFLRSLGWDENSGDDEGLTEEEINAFYQDVLKMRATSKLCHEFWPKILSHVELHGAATSEPSASTSRTEA